MKKGEEKKFDDVLRRLLSTPPKLREKMKQKKEKVITELLEFLDRY
jgi:hypothetical protein